jgi:phosphate transport system permease protein
MAGLLVASLIAILTTLGIILSLLFESLRFFSMVPPQDFLFGLSWSPQVAIRPTRPARRAHSARSRSSGERSSSARSSR